MRRAICFTLFRLISMIEKVFSRKEYICFKVTKEEKETIRKLAWCQRSTMNEFIRYVILSKYVDDFIR